MTNPTGEPDPVVELEKWFGEQHGWLQDAARRFIQNNGVLDEHDFDELVLLCKADAGIPLPEGTSLVAQSIPDGKLARASNIPKFWIEEIGSVRGVNALSPRHSLKLPSQCLNIVYGRNGTGKSGYVRLLKQACGAKGGPGTLHVDVTKENPDTPSATIRISDGGTPKPLDWASGMESLADLRGTDIYDTRSGSVYIDKENKVTYEPFPLQLLRELADVICKKVGERIDAETTQIPSIAPPLPSGNENTEAGGWYLGLSHLTTDEDVQKRCAFSKDEADELEALKKLLSESDPSAAAKVLRNQKSDADFLAKSLEGLLDSLSDARCAEYVSKQNTVAEAKQVAAEFAKANLTGNLEGVATDTWRAMWEAARKYSTELAYPAHSFPNVGTDALCVLCEQPLQEAARTRLTNLERFVAGDLQRAAQVAEQARAVAEEGLGETTDNETVQLRLNSAGLREGELRDAVAAAFKTFVDRKHHLLSKGKAALPKLPNRVVLEQLTQYAAGLETKAAQHDALDKTRKTKQARANELAAKQWLSQHVEHIGKEVHRHKTVHQLQNANSLTNSRGLTTRSKEISKHLITKKLLGSFQDELKNLGASHVEVKVDGLPPRRGVVPHRISLRNNYAKVGVAEVLSEGEQRIVSIAAFLADVHDRGVFGPMIFDDPISSLDDEYAQATIKRLVDLSKERQVIVFTHRISLVAGLRAAAQKVKQDVDGAVIGLHAQPWGKGEPGDVLIEVKAPGAILEDIKQRAQAAKTVFETDGWEAYNPIAIGICTDLRKALERLVERELLLGIVERFRQKLTVDGPIARLKSITEQDCELFDLMLDRYSDDLHPQPDEAPIPLPEPDRVLADVQTLIAWRSEYRKRTA